MMTTVEHRLERSRFMLEMSLTKLEEVASDMAGRGEDERAVALEHYVQFMREMAAV